jgi:hypothetical protein
MSGLGNRMTARLRGQKTSDAEIISNDAGMPDTAAADAGQNPDAIYAAALNLLSNEQTSGRLDKDLAAAAARSLGQVYGEKHVPMSEATAERSRKALQTESAAYRIREKLLGSSKSTEDSLLSSLEAAVSDLRQLLTAVRRQGESANRHNNGRPIQDQSLPGGWERSVIESIAKIQAIMSGMSQLAQAHEKAVSDFEALRH